METTYQGLSWPQAKGSIMYCNHNYKDTKLIKTDTIEHFKHTCKDCGHTYTSKTLIDNWATPADKKRYNSIQADREQTITLDL